MGRVSIVWTRRRANNGAHLSLSLSLSFIHSASIPIRMETLGTMPLAVVDKRRKNFAFSYFIFFFFIFSIRNDTAADVGERVLILIFDFLWLGFCTRESCRRFVFFSRTIRWFLLLLLLLIKGTISPIWQQWKSFYLVFLYGNELGSDSKGVLPSFTEFFFHS